MRNIVFQKRLLYKIGRKCCIIFFVALRIIVEESLAQNKNGTITDSTISKVKDKYGIFAPDGSEILTAK